MKEAQSQPFPQPARGILVLLVLIIVLIGTAIYWSSFKILQPTNILELPGAKGISLSYLPKEQSRKGLEIEDIVKLAQAGAFIPIPPSKTSVVQNQIANEDRWCEIRFEEGALPANRVVLDLIWRAYDQSTLYQRLANGQWKSTVSGTSMPLNKFEHLRGRNTFELDLSGSKPLVVYLHVKDYYRQPAKLRVWVDPDTFNEVMMSKSIRIHGYFFLWLTMMLYSFFHYALIRQADQYYLAMTVLMLGLVAISHSGLASSYITFPDFPLSEVTFSLFLCLALRSLTFFARHLLDTSEDPRLDQMLHQLRWGWRAGIVGLPMFFFPSLALYYVVPLVAIAITTLAINAMVGIRRWWKNGKLQGLFFSLALTPHLAGSVCWFSLFKSQNGPITEHWPGLQIGNAMTIVLLSLVSASRHRLALQKSFDLQHSYARRLEHEVEVQTDELRQLSRNLSAAVKQRDQLLTIIGHDLRGPMMSIDMQIKRMRKSISSGSDKMVEWLNKMGGTCHSQLELLNNLLVWGGLRSSHWKQIPDTLKLREEVSSTWNLFAEMSQIKQITFIDETPQNLDVHADRQLLHTILRNLLSNALKFTPAGGSITVRAVPQSDDKVEIQIQDTGVGMNANSLNLLWSDSKESTSGTSDEKGSGIGLGICRDLVKAAGGTIQLRSSLGIGTTALFTIPCYGSNQTPARIQRTPSL